MATPYPGSPMIDRLRRSFAALTPRQRAIVGTLALVSIFLALAAALLFRRHNRKSDQGAP